MLMKKNIIFQNEVASFAYRLLKEYPMIAKAIVERFPVIIIDEAQDTSEEQMAVFDLLTEAGIKSIFLVGDPDQAAPARSRPLMYGDVLPRIRILVLSQSAEVMIKNLTETGEGTVYHQTPNLYPVALLLGLQRFQRRVGIPFIGS